MQKFIIFLFATLWNLTTVITLPNADDDEEVILDWQCWFLWLFKIRFELGSQRFKSSRLNRSSESEVSSSISEGSVFTLSNRLSRVDELCTLWSQPNRSQVLVLVKVLEESKLEQSKNEDVEDKGEFDVDEAKEPQLAFGLFLLGSSFRYFSIS